MYHGGRFDALELVAGIKEGEIVLVLYPQEEEREEPIVRDFMETDEFQYYMKDAKDVLSFKERLHHVRDCLHLGKDAHTVTRAELDLCRARVLMLEAMLCNCGRRGEEGESKAANVEADGNLDKDTTTQVDNVGPNRGDIYDNVVGANSTAMVCELECM